MTGPIYVAGQGDTLNVGSSEYRPGDLNEIDKAIRHMPGVVAHMRVKALEMLELIGSDNFDYTLQNDPETQRPRAYVHPINNQGIHEELSQSVLLKAAIAMEGR